MQYLKNVCLFFLQTKHIGLSLESNLYNHQFNTNYAAFFEFSNREAFTFLKHFLITLSKQWNALNMIHVNVRVHHFVMNMYIVFDITLLNAITIYILDESELFQWTSNSTLEFH